MAASTVSSASASTDDSSVSASVVTNRS